MTIVIPTVPPSPNALLWHVLRLELPAPERVDLKVR
jgi:hypothetical protein